MNTHFFFIIITVRKRDLGMLGMAARDYQKRREFLSSTPRGDVSDRVCI